MDRLDLDAYCLRIGYHGPREPTLDVLRALHGLHTERIPFENLGPLTGEPVLLDAASLERKLVGQRRGGYCYEHNGLFGRVLRQLGFEVRALGARVRWNRPPGPPPARTHLLLQVRLDGQAWIADVGFGGLTLTAPLKLEPGLEQATPHEPFRITAADDGGFALEARLARHWMPLYGFDLQPQVQADHELTSWYLCHHPQSPFLTGLMAARPVPGGRHALSNNRYAFRRSDGTSDKRTLGSLGELEQVLAEAFGIELPGGDAYRRKLTTLLGAPAPAPVLAPSPRAREGWGEVG